MKLTLAILSFFIVIFSSCSDNGCKPVKPESEDGQMMAYSTAKGYAVTKHSTGMYYQILNPGAGPTPTLSSRVFVTYTGKKLDDAVFDQSTVPVSFGLSQLIEGWQVGLQLIKKGGSIRLIVPSSMAYGCTGSGNIIPSNSVLYFDITLVDVQ